VKERLVIPGCEEGFVGLIKGSVSVGRGVLRNGDGTTFSKAKKEKRLKGNEPCGQGRVKDMSRNVSRPLGGEPGSLGKREKGLRRAMGALEDEVERGSTRQRTREGSLCFMG